MATGFKKATVNASDVAATLTDYPTYIDLSRLGITTQAEADSVRVYADEAKTTEWAREIVDEAEMHVLVPSLTSTVDVYIDWDGARSDYAVTATFGAEAVWADYEVVSHFSEITGTSAENSTGNTDGTASRDAIFTEETVGQIGTGAFFVDRTTNDYIGYGTGFNGFVDPTDSYTVNIWMKTTLDSIQQAFYGVSGNAAGQAISRMQTRSNGAIRASVGGTASTVISSTTTFDDGSYHKLDLTVDNRATELWGNGVSEGTGTGGTTTTSGIGQMVVGTQADDSSAAVSLDGSVDEFRLRASVLSDNWLVTEYNNQSDESGFWGTWTTVEVVASSFIPKTTIL